MTLLANARAVGTSLSMLTTSSMISVPDSLSEGSAFDFDDNSLSDSFLDKSVSSEFLETLFLCAFREACLIDFASDFVAFFFSLFVFFWLFSLCYLFFG